jgi:Zn-dependent protease
VTDWFSLFAVYRVLVIRNDEVIQGVLRPDLRPGSPDLEEGLRSWPGRHYLQSGPAGVELTLVRPIARPETERWWLHLLLGLLTLATTTLAGAYLQGHEPLRLAAAGIGPLVLPLPVALDPSAAAPGLFFSIPLLVVLLGHELGHYFAARRHGMDVSPPYFIPAPHWLNLIGTFGAFIRLRSVTMNRGVLMDVGAAGPLISFVLSLPLAVAGLAMSRELPLASSGPAREYLVLFGSQPVWLGGSLSFDLLSMLAAPGGGSLLLHPFAFAGWLGLFVTALNLFPLAQLDGGHILYALMGPRQRWIGTAFLGVLLGLGFWWWGWWLWAMLILVIGKGSVRHPSVFDPTLPLPRRRAAVGWACIVIFLLTFVAFPLRV